MADFSSYTHKWRATTNNDQRDDTNKISKRNRQPVSCVPCRTRKLKCDRGHPCDSCTKRSDEDSCVYGKVANSTTNGVNLHKDDSRASSKKAQDRLRHLEELVKRMIEPSQRSDAPNVLTPPSIDSCPRDSPKEGILSKDSEGASYAGSTHWSAILEHIHELKQDLNSEELTASPAVDFTKPDSLFGAPRPPSLENVLQNHLPTRVQVDRRLSQYFNAKYMIVPFIHMKQFQRQYEAFWENPLGTHPLWVSMMFSICCLAANLSAAAQTEDATPPGTVSPRESFQTASEQCLILGNYSKPQPFLVEALALFLQCKYAASLDPSLEVALLFAMQTRLAYMMGYHRDGSNFPNQFTPFESEMRRRTWAMMKQFDVMVSFQLGVPSTIPPKSSDTRLPSNLQDADFDEDVFNLPPPRPDNEPTQTLYFTVKARLIDVFAKICQHAISFFPQAPTNAEIMALDAEIRQMADSVPSVMRHRRISESITDPGYLIMVRLNISFLWKKGLCVLHRKYMAQGDNEYSFNACIEAASSMCDTLLDLYPEFQLGGLFEKDRWMLTSFTIMDFLFSCMILCLALSTSRKKQVKPGGDPQPWLQTDQTRRLMELLERSQIVCSEFGSRSKEAKRVSTAVAAVLEKLKAKNQSATKVSDGTKFFANMSTGPIKNLDSNTSSKENANQDNFSLTPLSLAEKPTSITPQTGMFPPEAFATDKTPSTYLGEISLNTADNAQMLGQQQQQRQQQQDSTGGRTSTVSGPATPWPLPMDTELGPFSSIMEGPGQIDWTQFDQFAGPYGPDFFGVNADINAFSDFAAAIEPNLSNESDNMQFSTDWESTPHRFLGGDVRDPMLMGTQMTGSG